MPFWRLYKGKETNRMKKRKIEQFKQGIFSLRTNFGELAQVMIQKDMGYFAADNNSYDLQDHKGRRIEVKFSRAYKKDIPLTAKTPLNFAQIAVPGFIAPLKRRRNHRTMIVTFSR